MEIAVPIGVIVIRKSPSILDLAGSSAGKGNVDEHSNLDRLS